jgi:hypothetical protein
MLADYLFKIFQLTRSAAQLESVTIAAYSNASRVISAIFQPPQALNNERDNLFAADVADNSTHKLPLLSFLLIDRLRRRDGKLPGVFEMEPKFFNNRIGEHFARDPLDLGMGGGGVQRLSQPDYEILALPHVLDPLILHLLKGAVNGLPLRVENRLFERDIDMSLHFA